MVVPSLAQVLAGRPWAQHQERLNLTLGSQEQVGSPTLLALPVYCHSTVIVSSPPSTPLVVPSLPLSAVPASHHQCHWLEGPSGPAQWPAGTR